METSLRKILLLLLIFFPWRWGGTLAQESPLRLDFFEALRLAQERHVEAIVSEQRVQQSMQRIREARSSLYPQFLGTTSQYRRTVNLQTFGIDFQVPGFNPYVAPFNVFDARLSLTQNLFDATVLSRLKEAKAALRFSESDQRKVRLDVMALVANLFLEAHRAQQRIPWVELVLLRDQTRWRLSQVQNNIGLGAEIDVTQAKADLEQSEAQLKSAQTEALERRLDVAAALGLPQDRPIHWVLENKLDKVVLPKADALPALVSSHPEVERARLQVVQREQEKKTEVAAFYPKISGNADYGASGNHPGKVDDTYNFGGQLSIPLYQGGLRQARIREAQSKIQESQAQWEDALRQQEAKATQALAAVGQTLRMWQATQAQCNFAKRQLMLAENRLQSGLGSQLEVIEARAAQAMVLDQQSEAVAAYYQAKVNLAHASGTLEGFQGENHP